MSYIYLIQSQFKSRHLEGANPLRKVSNGAVGRARNAIALHALRQCAAQAPAHIRQVFWWCSTGSSKKYKSISFFYKHCFATSVYFWFCVSAKSCQNLRLKNWISKNNYFLLWTSEAFCFSNIAFNPPCHHKSLNRVTFEFCWMLTFELWFINNSILMTE